MRELTDAADTHSHHYLSAWPSAVCTRVSY